MGAHVSAVPNHQTGRVTSFHTRGVTAMAGTFGCLLYTSIDEAILDGVKNFLKDSEMRKNSATWQDMNRGRN